MASCLLCANLCQCNAIDFGRPILCGCSQDSVVINYQLMCNDGLIQFLSLENEPFYLVKLTFQRKPGSTSNFKLHFSPSIMAIIGKIIYRPFIIHFKGSKTDANSFSLMTPLSTFVHYQGGLRNIKDIKVSKLHRDAYVLGQVFGVFSSISGTHGEHFFSGIEVY